MEKEGGIFRAVKFRLFVFFDDVVVVVAERERGENDLELGNGASLINLSHYRFLNLNPLIRD